MNNPLANTMTNKKPKIVHLNFLEERIVLYSLAEPLT